MPQTRSAAARSQACIGSVPDDVIACVLSDLQAKDLCKLACSSKRFRTLTSSNALWKPLFVSQLVANPGTFTIKAGQGCGWKRLYASKSSALQRHAPWRKPCAEEVDAALKTMLNDKQNATAVFLVDGSGSVGDDEFDEMKAFICTATQSFAASARDCKVCILQFSNDVRVERLPSSVESVEDFNLSMKQMTRMNGGTNIAVALQKAGQLLKAENGPADSHRLLVLLTDGRVDAHQARESSQVLETLADELGPVSMYALGVGRGVDAGQLVSILEGAGRNDAAQRYVELCVRDDAYW